MVKIEFYGKNGSLLGFEMSGHSGYAEAGSDIICASVSSCAYMAANTITEIIEVNADISVDEAYMKVMVDPDDAEKVKIVLEGLKLHVKALAEEYRKYISCTVKTIN